LESEVARATVLSDITMLNEWREAWEEEWLPQLNVIGSDNDKLRFLREFKVVPSQQSLEGLGDSLLAKLRRLFSLDESAAVRLRAHLDSALRVWATSMRGNTEAITRESIYEKLCLVDDVLIGDHDLPPPAPFFETRLPVLDQVGSHLEMRTHAVVFVVGEPGSGKTALISALANRRDTTVGARFHAYRPITPENQLLPADAGRTTTSRALWTDLLIQLRSVARGRLVPRRRESDGLSPAVHSGRRRIGKASGATSNSIERATPG
jgi:hypothetical protein